MNRVHLLVMTKLLTKFGGTKPYHSLVMENIFPLKVSVTLTSDLKTKN